MKISILGSLTINSPLSSPKGKSPLITGELIFPTSTSSSPFSSNQLILGNVVLRASHSFNGRTISASFATKEKRDITFRRKNDHYALLGVSCHASCNDIRVAYKRLALKYHPDVMPLQQLETTTDLYSEINQVYDTVSDPQKRKAYDDLHLIPNFDTVRVAASPSSFEHWRGRNWETDRCWW